jgi:hypothetical protein
MAYFTKGDWTVKPPDWDNERGIVVYNSLDKGIVARVATLGGSRHEVVLNAYLISASKDMYYELTQCTDILKRILDITVEQGYKNIIKEQINDNKLVLKKAIGG